MNTPWRPANGTEGADFERSWCRHCLNDKWPDWEDEFGNDVPGRCPILDMSQWSAPDEWVLADGLPACISYAEDPLNPPRCPKTMEMFG